ncbi:hypothetical protein ALQ18_01699 [Pseudomonas marginalis pv. marginalis]|nr:hypothetical protein ALQ18_01699 [Pseudomonas marginalis pv. marginalis]
MTVNATLDLYTTPAFFPLQTEPTEAIRQARGIATTAYLWPQNSTITISMFDMPDGAKDYIKKNINLWQPYTNLKFDFINSNDGDIRISGKKDAGGCWSAIGTEAKTLPIGDPTMHIDLVQTADLLNQSIRHEFGHALGLEHEHQHPDNTIKWDTGKLYKAAALDNISDAGTYENFLKPHNPTTTTQSAYDAASIMHYKVLPSVTTDGSQVGFNEELSEGDKNFMTFLYPPTSVSPLP